MIVDRLNHLCFMPCRTSLIHESLATWMYRTKGGRILPPFTPISHSFLHLRLNLRDDIGREVRNQLMPLQLSKISPDVSRENELRNWLVAIVFLNPRFETKLQAGFEPVPPIDDLPFMSKDWRGLP